MNGMSKLVRTATAIVAGFMFIFGCYVMAQAHLSHGAGFAGGVIAALALMLPVITLGRERAKKLTRVGTLLIPLMSTICALFLGLACLDLYWRDQYGSWFIGPGNPHHYFSAGLITPLNILFCIAAALMLMIVFICLSDSARENGND